MQVEILFQVVAKLDDIKGDSGHYGARTSRAARWVTAGTGPVVNVPSQAFRATGSCVLTDQPRRQFMDFNADCPVSIICSHITV